MNQPNVLPPQLKERSMELPCSKVLLMFCHQSYMMCYMFCVSVRDYLSAERDTNMFQQQRSCVQSATFFFLRMISLFYGQCKKSILIEQLHIMPNSREH